MTAFDPARPRYTLPLAGAEYELLGTFALIEAVEYAAKAHVGVVAAQVVNGMPVHELARVLSAVLTACGHKLSTAEAAGLLWDKVGLTGDGVEALRLHLYAFLSVCLAPPAAREGRARDMGELLGRLTAASPGRSTEESASGS